MALARLWESRPLRGRPRLLAEGGRRKRPPRSAATAARAGPLRRRAYKRPTLGRWRGRCAPGFARLGRSTRRPPPADRPRPAGSAGCPARQRFRAFTSREREGRAGEVVSVKRPSTPWPSGMATSLTSSSRTRGAIPLMRLSLPFAVSKPCNSGATATAGGSSVSCGTPSTRARRSRSATRAAGRSSPAERPLLHQYR
jgi:hypothetical protein